MRLNLLFTAPSIIRKRSHRYPHTTTQLGCVCTGNFRKLNRGHRNRGAVDTKLKTVKPEKCVNEHLNEPLAVSNGKLFLLLYPQLSVDVDLWLSNYLRHHLLIDVDTAR